MSTEPNKGQGQTPEPPKETQDEATTQDLGLEAPVEGIPMAASNGTGTIKVTY